MSSDKSIKLSEFIEASPQAWWLTCESVFESRKVVKPVDHYYHLVAALPSTVTVKLLDVLTFQAEDEGEKLSFLKSWLMELYAPTESESFDRMSSITVLQPGQKQSALYANLRALLPHNVGDVDNSFFFRMMFLKRLPKRKGRSLCLRWRPLPKL